MYQNHQGGASGKALFARPVKYDTKPISLIDLKVQKAAKSQKHVFSFATRINNQPHQISGWGQISDVCYAKQSG